MRPLIAVAALLAIASLASATPSAAAATLDAHGSVEQVYATGVSPGARVSLVRNGRVLAVRSADSLGGVLFRNVVPGTGFRVRVVGGRAASGPLRVLSTRPAPPSTSVYRQSVPATGYGYITMRDGIKLAVDVHRPQSLSGAAPGPGPTPTLIEYAGYGYANPAGPQSGIATLANLMGYTVVDVNMRGTGCSGGAFDYFETLQNLDGYDVIETIARQPWVLHHKVGMMGISYGGISQLFTAQTDPPHLAAISPLSVIDQTATTLYPGGILNTGFAVAWAKDRVHDAEPASPTGGQPWAYQRIQQGDQVCKRNQALHGEAANLLAKTRANSHYVPSVADPLSPITFVNRIKVPVFMACQFEDEQTGGHCPALVSHMTGTRHKWFTFTNGAHIDSLDPESFNRWCDFLALYVARRAPVASCPALRAAAPVIYQQAMGISGIALPADPIQSQPSYAGALAAFQALPEVRVLFDNGAGTAPTGTQTPGDPYPAFERSFSRLPVPGTTARSWYLGPNGTLGAKPPARRGVNVYTSNAKALALTDYGPNTGTGGLWGNASQWDWRWNQNRTGSAVSYLSAPLTANATVVGGGAVYVWIRSSKPNVDLLATVSEVRSDGKETFVQNGYMRADERKLSYSANNISKQPSSLLYPVPSELASDLQPLPRNSYVEVPVPLYYEGHAYRAGSRIRITIAAPNGTQPVWSFSQTVPKGTANVSVAFSKRMPSRLVLPVVPGVHVPAGLPPCPGLRNEPCRTYQPLVNRTARR